MDQDRSIPFGARLRAREPVIGTVLTVPSVPLAELVGARLDFVWIDLEHGALDLGDVQPLAIAARSAGCATLARLPGPGPAAAAILDSGIDGVVAPRVESAAAAHCLVEALRSPPRGTRGFAARRASAYGAADPPEDPLCWAQIESAAGVESTGEIAAVEGVDALVVGCAYLALALDGTVAGYASSTRVREAIAHVQAAAAAQGVASGIAGPDDPALLRELAGADSTVLVHSADVRIYARAVSDAVAALEAAHVGA